MRSLVYFGTLGDSLLAVPQEAEARPKGREDLDEDG
jgi:hypothetical protein